jgi:anti-anti-sigma regulatory factor
MDQSNDTCVTLVFDGARTIATSEETLLRLREANERGLPVEIDCSGLTAVDLSFVQLLIAGQRSLSAAGHNLTVRARASGPLESGLKAGGFHANPDISDFITFSA